MAESVERGRSMLCQEVQRKQSWECHGGKELMEPQIHHHLFLIILF